MYTKKYVCTYKLQRYFQWEKALESKDLTYSSVLCLYQRSDKQMSVSDKCLSLRNVIYADNIKTSNRLSFRAT